VVELPHAAPDPEAVVVEGSYAGPAVLAVPRSQWEVHLAAAAVVALAEVGLVGPEVARGGGYRAHEVEGVEVEEEGG